MTDQLFKIAQVIIPGLVIITWLVLNIMQALGRATVTDGLTSAAYACLGLFTGFAIVELRARNRIREVR